MTEERPSWDEMAALIGEGHCPLCRGRLEPKDDLAVCTPCRRGWRLRKAKVGEEWMATEDAPMVIDEDFLLDLSKMRDAFIVERKETYE